MNINLQTSSLDGSFVLKTKKILSVLLSFASILYLTGCSSAENSKPDISENPEEYFTVTNNVTLSRDLAYVDNIRSAGDSVYVCGYSYKTNQQYVFSVFDQSSGKLSDIDVSDSETGDVSAVYLGSEKFYVGYRNGKSTWFSIYDIKTGNEIKKIPVEDDVRIAAFFEDKDGSIIADIRDSFGYGYIEKCSPDYTMTGKIRIYEQISNQNMKILNMLYCNSCYYVVAEETSVSESKINIYRVSEDGSINESFADAVPDSDGTYVSSYINSNGNLCIVSRTQLDTAQITVNEMKLSGGSIINSYYDDFSFDSLVQTDGISDCSGFVYIQSEKAFSYIAEEQKNTELDTGGDNRTLLCSSDNKNKILMCSNVFTNIESPVIYQYDTEGKLIDELHPDSLNITGTALKSDVLSDGNVCTLYKDSSDKYSVLWSDFKGNTVREVSVFDEKNLSSPNIWAGTDNELYCLGYDEENDVYSIEVYNSDARKIRNLSGISGDISINEVFSMNGSDYILCTDDSGDTKICPAGNETADESENFSYPELDIEKIFSCSDGRLCYFDSDNVYKTEEKSFKSKKIINWSNSGIIYKVEAMCMPDDDRAVCFTSGNGYTITVLERADEQTAEKMKNQKIITVGGVSISSTDFTQAIEKFNNDNPEYRVCINDYLKYNSRDPEDCILKLNLDIVSGKIPDIFIGSDSFDLKFYAEKDMFCDLNSFIESDEEIRRTDFLENIFDCYKTKEKQSCVPINFDIYALTGKKTFLGSGTGWTPDEFYKTAEGKNMFYDSSVSSLCESLLFADLSDYIDWENKKCSFTDGRFEKIAEYIYTTGIPDDKYIPYYDYPTESEEYGNYYRRFSDNLCYTELSGISSLSALASLQNGTLNNEKIVLKGIPSVSKSGPLVYSRNTAGISSASENKEGAWKFIKMLLSDEYQTKTSSIASFPVKISVFNSLIENSRRTGFGFRTDGTFYDTAPLTEEDVSEFVSIIKTADRTYSCNSRIKEIMTGVLDEYFNGKIKVNEAAEQIQNKVSLYLDEIR